MYFVYSTIGYSSTVRLYGLGIRSIGFTIKAEHQALYCTSIETFICKERARLTIIEVLSAPREY